MRQASPSPDHLSHAASAFSAFPCGGRSRTVLLMNKNLIWTIVGILLIIALIIWIMRAL
jgi:hypothetical protein